MKEFTSSVQVRSADQPALKNLDFTLDDQDYTLRAPKNAQVAFLMASSAANRSTSDRVAAILDFIEAALVSPGDEILRGRLLDPNDNLELEHVMAIIEWAMEEWTGRPPTSATGSSRQRSVAGRRSKAIASGAASGR